MGHTLLCPLTHWDWVPKGHSGASPGVAAPTEGTGLWAPRPHLALVWATQEGPRAGKGSGKAQGCGPHARTLPSCGRLKKGPGLGRALGRHGVVGPMPAPCPRVGDSRRAQGWEGLWDTSVLSPATPWLRALGSRELT